MAIIAAGAAGLIYYLSKNPNIQEEEEYIGLRVPGIEIDGQTIEFPYTDDNSNESIIIKTDKKTYNSFAGSDVYYSVTNTSNMAEKVVLLAYFSKDQSDIKNVKVRQLGEWQDMQIQREGLQLNSTKLAKALTKRKPIPEDFTVKGGTQFEIPAGHTAYFKSEITYPPGKDGEFWIEALGTNGGYGLLDPWYSSSWSYRRQIDIDFTKVASSSGLSNFPVLINITNPDIKHTTFGGKVASSSAGVTGGGGDFVFTSSDGTTKLDHEIEKYASSSGELWAWVEVPTLSVSADTTLYMYYGGPSSGATNQNPTGVWDSNFVGVWHMSEDPTRTCAGTKEMCDSTSNNNDVDSNGSQVVGDQLSGKIAGSLNFDGTNDYLEGADSDSLDVSNAVTVSLWVYPREDGNGNEIPIFRKQDASDSCGAFTLFLYTQWGLLSTDSCNWANRGNSSTPTLNKWQHVVATYDGTSIRYYINGDIRDTKNLDGVGAPNTSVFSIGGPTITGWLTSQYLNGILDEIKISNTARPAAWIKTEYTNQNKPSTFATLSGTQVQIRTAAGLKIGTTASTDTTPGWYQNGATPWDYRRAVTVDKSRVSGTSDLSNFPMLVYLSTSDLKHTSFGGKVASSSAGITGGGGDFVFTSSNGTTKLDHEIEKYASSSGELWAWVEVPTLSVSADTTLYMYYGGPSSGATNQNVSGTWNSNYTGVWHMKNDPTKTCRGTKEVCDSTGNNNDMDSIGDFTSDWVDGYLGKAVEFDNSDVTADYLTGSVTGGSDSTNTVTMQAWVKLRSRASYDGIFEGDDNANGFSRGILVGGATDKPLTFNWDNNEGDTATGLFVALDQWYYFVAVLNGNTANLYLGDRNGSLKTYSDSNTNTARTMNLTWNIGRDPNGFSARYFDGHIDEVRLVKAAQTDGWIKTEYNNQNKPGVFYSVSGLQYRTPSAPIKIRGGVKFK